MPHLSTLRVSPSQAEHATALLLEQLIRRPKVLRHAFKKLLWQTNTQQHARGERESPVQLRHLLLPLPIDVAFLLLFPLEPLSTTSQLSGLVCQAAHLRSAIVREMNPVAQDGKKQELGQLMRTYHNLVCGIMQRQIAQDTFLRERVEQLQRASHNPTLDFVFELESTLALLVPILKVVVGVFSMPSLVRPLEVCVTSTHEVAEHSSKTASSAESQRITQIYKHVLDTAFAQLHASDPETVRLLGERPVAQQVALAMLKIMAPIVVKHVNIMPLIGSRPGTGHVVLGFPTEEVLSSIVAAEL